MPTSDGLSEDLIRHMVLESLRSYRTKFKNEFGELVIAMDNVSWRKNVFPYYKANRKKDREKSKIDWDGIFQIIAKIRQELKDNMPYKVIDIEGAEADDVIAVLAMDSDEKVLIVSEDEDFLQLQKFPNIFQYAPIKKKTFLVEKNPVAFLQEHICSGDSSDGIPNILSDDDTFVNENKRQSPMTKKKMQQIKDDTFEWSDALKRNYERNKLLIDLTNTPESVKIKIKEQFAQKPNSRQKVLNYFIQYKLKNLMKDLSEF